MTFFHRRNVIDDFFFIGKMLSMNFFHRKNVIDDFFFIGRMFYKNYGFFDVTAAEVVRVL